MNDKESKSKEDKKFKNKVTIWVALIGIILFIVFIGYCCSSGSSAPAQKSEQSLKIEALVGSQMVVKDNLKSPSSAEFPLITDKLISVTKIEENKYAVISYVDSENSFGAMIRTFYTCKVILDGDKYTVVDLKFLD